MATAYSMNRYDLQTLAGLRVKEGKTLLDNGCYQGAYYVLGYAIECALKACIAKETREFDFPEKKLVNDSHTHDLSKLLGLSRLTDEMNHARKANKTLDTYWSLVVAWDEDARYVTTASKELATDLHEAITDPTSGVLEWLKKWW